MTAVFPRLGWLLLCGSLCAFAAAPRMRCVTPAFASPLTRVPSNGTRRVVVLGSSTAMGTGASDVNHSWVGLLTAALAPQGITVINNSISGTATADSLSRFSRDVTPYHPDFVVLATSLWNEGFSSDPVNVRNTYLANTRTLIGLVNSIGAVPILIGVYPNSTSTPVDVSIILGIYAEFETLGVPVWDFWNGLADSQGNWLPGLSADGTHPLDAGHRDLFDAIPTSYFEAAYQSPGLGPAANAIPGSWLSGGTDQNPGQVVVQVAQLPSSWSAAVWFKTAPVTGAAVILSIGAADVQFLRTPAGYYLEVRGVPVIVDFVPSEAPPAWHQVLLTYGKEQKLLSAYLDGVPLGSVANIDPPGSGQFSVGGGAEPCNFSQFLVYRSPLNAGDASTLAAFVILRKSIESWVELSSGSSRGLTNSAGTATSASTTGAWSFDPSSRVGQCTALPRPSGPGAGL